MEMVTTNALGQVRRERVDGRDYIVAPVSMVVPGVLPGSKGPLLYTPQELQTNVDAWNGMPVVINHPYEMGMAVSARHPKVLERQGVGAIYNTNFRGKLRSEAWIDIDRVRKLNPSLLANLEAGRPMEVSTGLFTDNEEQAGHHNGRAYTHVAKNYRPDHLALLPDQRGACSVSDGCGLNVNQESLVVTNSVLINDEGGGSSLAPIPAAPAKSKKPAKPVQATSAGSAEAKTRVDAVVNWATTNANPEGCNQYKTCDGSGTEAEKSADAQHAKDKAAGASNHASIQQHHANGMGGSKSAEASNAHVGASRAHAEAAKHHETASALMAQHGNGVEANEHGDQAALHMRLAREHAEKAADAKPGGREKLAAAGNIAGKVAGALGRGAMAVAKPVGGVLKEILKDIKDAPKHGGPGADMGPTLRRAADAGRKPGKDPTRNSNPEGHNQYTGGGYTPSNKELHEAATGKYEGMTGDKHHELSVAVALAPRLKGGDSNKSYRALKKSSEGKDASYEHGQAASAHYKAGREASAKGDTTAAKLHEMAGHLHWAMRTPTRNQLQLIVNEFKQGLPRSQVTGKLKPMGAGYGKGPIHEAAQGGSLHITDGDRELVKAVREGMDPEWAQDSGTWEKALKAAAGDNLTAVRIYQNLGGKLLTQNQETNVELTANQRETIIGALVTNGCGCWKEEDKEFLTTRTDNRLVELAESAIASEEREAVVNAVKEHAPALTVNAMPAFIKEKMGGGKGKEKEAKGEEEETPAEESTETPEEEATEEEESPTQNAPKGPKLPPITGPALGDGSTAVPIRNKKGSCTMNAAEWLDKNGAPEEIRQLVTNSIAHDAQVRTALANQLTANFRGTPEAKKALVANLSLKKVDDLQMLASLVPQPVQNHIAARPSIYGGPVTPVANTDEDKDDILELPTMNYGAAAV